MPRTPDAYLLLVAAGTDADLLDNADTLAEQLDGRAPVHAAHRTAGAFDLLLELRGTPEQIADYTVALQADPRILQTLTLPRVG